MRDGASYIASTVRTSSMVHPHTSAPSIIYIRFVQRFVNHVPRGRVRYHIHSRHMYNEQRSKTRPREFAKLALSFIQRSCSASQAVKRCIQDGTATRGWKEEWEDQSDTKDSLLLR